MKNVEIDEVVLQNDAEELLANSSLKVFDTYYSDDTVMYDLGFNTTDNSFFTIKVPIDNDIKDENELREFCKENLKTKINQQLDKGVDWLPMIASMNENSLLSTLDIEEVAEIYYLIEQNIAYYNEIENL